MEILSFVVIQSPSSLMDSTLSPADVDLQAIIGLSLSIHLVFSKNSLLETSTV